MKQKLAIILFTLCGFLMAVPKVQNVEAAAPKSTYKNILKAYKKNDYKKVNKLSKKLPASANEKCVKKMKSTYKKAAKKIVKKLGFYEGGEKAAILYYGYSDVNKDGKPEMIIKYGTSEQGSKIHIYEFKKGKYKKVKGSADAWHTNIYNYTSGNGLVLKSGTATDRVYETVRLVTLKKGKMTTKLIRKRVFDDLNKRVTLPCAIKTYY